MADGDFGERIIVLDINATVTARVIRDALLNQNVKIMGIIISGTTPATDGSIVFRKESASGPIVWKFGPTAVSSAVHVQEVFNELAPVFNGLYADLIPTAWAAGSLCLIYTA